MNMSGGHMSSGHMDGGDSGMASGQTDSGMSTMPTGMSMQMTFYWSTSATILFDAWKVSTVAEYIAALIGVFLFCMLHELLTTYRMTFIATACSVAARTTDGNSSETNLKERIMGPCLSGTSKLIGALLYTLNAASSYLIMLIIMSFNLGLFLAVILGLGAGFLLFGFGRSAMAAGDLCCLA
eukprot:TRINITY_DN2319_c0_g1_i3.p1 TRINITY_DN2319_c0_g1~~TRINITY_DN2319_c0_g1_i3.p1  ORF type:complete len:182 (+),score=24.00 TRINITY_DN2319_c0_g1_i3:482-1027(+)